MIGFRSKRKDDADVPTAETNAPEAKPASLRRVLKQKLLALAEAGDIAAIRELLNRPELLTDDSDLPKTLEGCVEAMDELLDRVRKRAMAANPNYIADAFNGSVRQRLVDEAKHGLVRRWDSLSKTVKDELWVTILECLQDEGGADGVLEKNQAVIQ